MLFRRVRTLLIRPHGEGLIATTLNFDYEVRSAREAFKGVSNRQIEGEMLDLAEHIIETKMGRFDPAAFEDRYEAALADLVKAKLKGRKIRPRKEPKREKVVDLLAALRETRGRRPQATGQTRRPQEGRPAAPRKKAG